MSEKLLNISPIDGRYSEKTQVLKAYFSEYALMKYRIEIEIKYFLFLINVLDKNLESKYLEYISDIFNNFSIDDCLKIKKYESKCNHDVKAVEYFIRDQFITLDLAEFTPLIHFGLTSQDINNTALTKSIKDYIHNTYLNSIQSIVENINTKCIDWKDMIMLSRTHGQPAVPTSLGKELRVFSYRIEKQIKLLKNIDFYGKIGGAVGNLNAHYLAYPTINWDTEITNFLKNKLSLKRDLYTTQIDNYENLAVLFDCIRRINTILIDMNRDIWQYISMDYLSQKVINDEVGSSTMPQKINPINFENSEGNLMIANTLLDFMSNKLPISRLQRDLTDSTITRNIGTIFGHCEISYQNCIKGLNKIIPNTSTLQNDLNNNLSVITEGLQTVLRREGCVNAYETVKDLARNNNKLTHDKYIKFVMNIKNIDNKTREQLMNLSPFNYTGNCTRSNLLPIEYTN